MFNQPVRRTRTLTIATALTALVLGATVLSGCTPANSTSSTGAMTLNIGTALPETGNLAFLGASEEAGVALAVADINAATQGITLDVTWGDSGDTDNKAYETEIPRLLKAGVSAIVGAASSSTSLQFIDQVTGAGVIQISPANTSTVFSTYDDHGLYFRTAPSDALQGNVLGNLVAGDGAATLGLIVQNDAYGTGLAGAVATAFTAAGGSVVAESRYNVGDTNFGAQISEVTAARPDAIVLVSFDEAKTILPQLIGTGFPANHLYYVDGNLADYSADFAPGLLKGGRGTYPGSDVSALTDFTSRLDATWIATGHKSLGGTYGYSAEAYDAVILLALASLEAHSTKGTDIAGKMVEVSGGSGNGQKCTSFADCARIIESGGIVDYDGISGNITWDAAGDPTDGAVNIYQYDRDNVPQKSHP